MILTVDIGNTTIALTGIERTGNDYNVIFTEKLSSDFSLSGFDDCQVLEYLKV